MHRFQHETFEIRLLKELHGCIHFCTPIFIEQQTVISLFVAVRFHLIVTRLS